MKRKQLIWENDQQLFNKINRIQNNIIIFVAYFRML